MGSAIRDQLSTIAYSRNSWRPGLVTRMLPFLYGLMEPQKRNHDDQVCRNCRGGADSICLCRRGPKRSLGLSRSTSALDATGKSSSITAQPGNGADRSSTGSAAMADLSARKAPRHDAGALSLFTEESKRKLCQT